MPKKVHNRIYYRYRKRHEFTKTLMKLVSPRALMHCHLMALLAPQSCKKVIVYFQENLHFLKKIEFCSCDLYGNSEVSGMIRSKTCNNYIEISTKETFNAPRNRFITNVRG